MQPDSPSALGESPYAALIRLATAYQASEALHVAARLRVADHLAQGLSRVEELAAATGTHAPSLRRLLRALAAFGVFREKDDGCFGLTPIGERLVAAAPGSARGAVMMFGHHDFRRTWSELEHSIRTGQTAAAKLSGTADFATRTGSDPSLLAAFTAGMSAAVATIADGLVAAVDFGSVRHVVDVGGGEGRLMGAILLAAPHLRGTLLDRAEVVARAGAMLGGMGVADRCDVIAGDMFAGVPAGGDLYVLCRVVHDWDDADAAAILAHCRDAMGSAGRLVLIERLLPDQGRMAPSPAVQGHLLSDLNMLVRTGGRERTRREYQDLLAAASLRLARAWPTSTPWSVLDVVGR